MTLFAPADTFLLLVDLVFLALSGWAFGDALLRPAAGFPAAGKLTKPAWLALTGACVLVSLFGSGLFSLLGGAAAVASLVYLLDVRPAVRGLRPGGPWR